MREGDYKKKNTNKKKKKGKRNMSWIGLEFVLFSFTIRIFHEKVFFGLHQKNRSFVPKSSHKLSHSDLSYSLYCIVYRFFHRHNQSQKKKLYKIMAPMRHFFPQNLFLKDMDIIIFSLRNENKIITKVIYLKNK